MWPKINYVFRIDPIAFQKRDDNTELSVWKNQSDCLDYVCTAPLLSFFHPCSNFHHSNVSRIISFTFFHTLWKNRMQTVPFPSSFYDWGVFWQRFGWKQWSYSPKSLFWAVPLMRGNTPQMSRDFYPCSKSFLTRLLSHYSSLKKLLFFIVVEFYGYYSIITITFGFLWPSKRAISRKLSIFRMCFWLCNWWKSHYSDVTIAARGRPLQGFSEQLRA